MYNTANSKELVLSGPPPSHHTTVTPTGLQWNLLCGAHLKACYAWCLYTNTVCYHFHVARGKLQWLYAFPLSVLAINATTGHSVKGDGSHTWNKDYESSNRFEASLQFCRTATPHHSNKPSVTPHSHNTPSKAGVAKPIHDEPTWVWIFGMTSQ